MTRTPLHSEVNLDPVRAQIREALAANDTADAVMAVVRPDLEAAARARSLHRREVLCESADTCPHDPPHDDNRAAAAWDAWLDGHPWGDDGDDSGHLCLASPVADRCPTCRDENGDHIPWPCATAIVLGLAPAPPTAGQWNAAHPAGTPVTVWPGSLDAEPVATHTRIVAVSRDPDHDAVYVEHVPGEVPLSHVQPRPDCDCCVCLAAATTEMENTR